MQYAISLGIGAKVAQVRKIKIGGGIKFLLKKKGNDLTILEQIKKEST